MLRLVAIVAGLIFAARALGRAEGVRPMPGAVPPHRTNEEDAEQAVRTAT